jgi:hypothetical protein
MHYGSFVALISAARMETPGSVAHTGYRPLSVLSRLVDDQIKVHR